MVKEELLLGSVELSGGTYVFGQEEGEMTSGRAVFGGGR